MRVAQLQVGGGSPRASKQTLAPRKAERPTFSKLKETDADWMSAFRSTGAFNLDFPDVFLKNHILGPLGRDCARIRWDLYHKTTPTQSKRNAGIPSPLGSNLGKRERRLCAPNAHRYPTWFIIFWGYNAHFGRHRVACQYCDGGVAHTCRNYDTLITPPEIYA